MGKKKAIMIFKGSIKSHWIKNVTSLNMNVDPVGTYGLSSSFRILCTLGTVDSNFCNPASITNLAR
jgi:hypothetical protein